MIELRTGFESRAAPLLRKGRKMERNWDTIREILLRFREKPSEEKALQLGDWPENVRPEISHHVNILIEGGLLQGKMHGEFGTEPDDFVVFGLTWNGHDFLDSIEDEAIWKKVKESFVSKGKLMTLELVKFVATNFIKELFK